jgi:hypothetical protein
MGGCKDEFNQPGYSVGSGWGVVVECEQIHPDGREDKTDRKHRGGDSGGVLFVKRVWDFAERGNDSGSEGEAIIRGRMEASHEEV